MARWVQTTATRPMHCSGFPGLGARHPKGYWDMSVDLDREHVYWSCEGVEDRARAQGWSPPEAVTDLNRRIVALEDELRRAKAELETERGFRKAIDVIESADFQARKKAGRPRKEEAVA